MKNLGLQEIRSEFLRFFETKEHLVLPSFSLIPKNDNSLLLIGAGMAPMKKYFTGELTPPKKRVTTCQKCIRTGDIENVGKTDRHATFFEMLGNFSFGDYFKKEAISWAWEFLTEWMELDPDRLWATVFYDDHEAAEIWEKQIHMPKERIIPMGREDNFWELEVGPSGPCSEIYYDRGPEHGCGDPDCKPGCECDRFIEVWNLVFTQFDKDKKGVYHPLAHPNIDTGMGLERIATVLQNTDNIFEVDSIRKIIDKIEDISGYKYKTDKEKDVSVRVIIDHVRAMCFLVSDTVRPSNEGRGYVLRRLIRRASRHGILLGIKGAFLTQLVDVVIDEWSGNYKEIAENREAIKDVIRREEAKFLETLDQGVLMLDNLVKELKEKKSNILDGKIAFKLYDTFGFPLDLTREILEEKELEVDEKGFDTLMEEQRERARNARNDLNQGWASKSNEEVYEKLSNIFVGYEKTEATGKVTSISNAEGLVEELKEGESGILTFDVTPFYGESGGQIGDTGEAVSKNAVLKVTDTKKTSSGIHLHLVEVVSGEVHKDDTFELKIDVKRRDNIRRNHSVTHLLHASLREVLGDHVNQSGSEVLDTGMRFDFTHFEPISEENLEEIERKVNEKIFEALPVETTITDLPTAQGMGAIGLFEEKYQDEVRVVKMGDYSMELCGGTHVFNTAQISMFKILSEGGISSGVRRIFAITGPEIYKEYNKVLDQRQTALNILKVNKDSYIDKLKNYMEETKALNKKLEEYEKDKALSNVEELIKNAKQVGDLNIVIKRFKDIDVDSLRTLADAVRDKLDNAVIVFATENEGKINLLTAVSKNTITNTMQAGKIVKEVAKIVGGGGGGRPDMAMAGGKDATKIDEALRKVEDIVKNLL